MDRGCCDKNCMSADKMHMIDDEHIGGTCSLPSPPPYILSAIAGLIDRAGMSGRALSRTSVRIRRDEGDDLGRGGQADGAEGDARTLDWKLGPYLHIEWKGGLEEADEVFGRSFMRLCPNLRS